MTTTSSDLTTTAAPAATAAIALLQDSRPAPSAIDAFSKLAGPDVAIGSGSAEVRAYAVFDVDPATGKVRIKVVDDTGQLIRLIPSESVAAMLAAMADAAIYVGRPRIAREYGPGRT